MPAPARTRRRRSHRTATPTPSRGQPDQPRDVRGVHRPEHRGPEQLGGWYDAAGFENGDECAYIYGPLSGAAGRRYNQTINGHHYLTQEEFSNADFFATYGRGGCVQQEPAPVINSVSPQSGSHSGGTQITLVGSYFTPAAQVTIGGRPATVLSRPDAGHLVVRTPAHAAGTVGGRGDHDRWHERPTSLRLPLNRP